MITRLLTPGGWKVATVDLDTALVSHATIIQHKGELYVFRGFIHGECIFEQADRIMELNLEDLQLSEVPRPDDEHGNAFGDPAYGSGMNAQEYADMIEEQM